MKFHINQEHVEWKQLLSETPSSFVRHNSHTYKIRKFPKYWIKQGDSSGRTWHIHNEGSCSLNWLAGDYCGYGRKDQASLNLKHVPKSIKFADYPLVSDWFEAVFKFVSGFKEKAKCKAKMKSEQAKLSRAIEFMDFKSEMEPVVEQFGFVPDTHGLGQYWKDRGYHSWNELWASKDTRLAQDSVAFSKGKVLVRADVKSSGAKLTIDNMPASKVRELVTFAAKLLSEAKPSN